MGETCFHCKSMHSTSNSSKTTMVGSIRFDQLKLIYLTKYLFQ